MCLLILPLAVLNLARALKRSKPHLAACEAPDPDNKRATIHYLLQDYKASIEDCRIVLQLNEYHFGAAAGLGMCLGRSGDYGAAVRAFETAIRINPRLQHLQHHIIQLKDIEDRDG